MLRLQEVHAALFLAAFFVLGIGIHVGVFVPGAHWSGDCAIQELQAEILIRSHFQQISIPYSAATWDAAGEYFPYSPPFAFKIGEQYYFAYPIFFSVLLAVSRWAAGVWGSAILLSLGATVFLDLTYRLAKILLPDKSRWALWLLGCSSPLLFYCGLFWGHTLAAALIGAGIYLMALNQHRPSARYGLLAGLAFGVATWIRTEGIALTAALTAAAFLYTGDHWKAGLRNALLILAGFTGALIPLAVVNQLLYGSLWGLHAGTALERWAALPAAPRRVYFGGPANPFFRLAPLDWFLFRSTNYFSFSVKTALPFLIFIFGCLFNRFRQRRSLILLNLLLIALVLLRVLWEVLTTSSRHVSGLFIVMPYTIVGFWFVRDLLMPRGSRRREDRLATFLLGFVVFYLFIATAMNMGSLGGLQWGPRYLIPIFGVLVVLSLKGALQNMLNLWTVKCFSCTWLLTGLFFVMGCVYLVIGLVSARQDEVLYDRVLEQIRQSDVQAVAAYQHRWLAQLCSPLYFEKDVFWIRTQEQLDQFLAQEKPYPNSAILFLTTDQPLSQPASLSGGESWNPGGRFHLWRPGEVTVNE